MERQKSFIRIEEHIFINEEIKRMCCEQDIKHSFSSPYYPQGNSVVERQFKIIKDLLFCTSKENRVDWEECLWMVQRSLRFSFNESIQMSPYESIFYRRPRINNCSPKYVTVESLQRKLIKKFHKACAKNISNKLSSSRFMVGDHVFAKILPIKKGVYLPKFDGPYTVDDIRGSSLTLKNVLTGKKIVRNEHHIKKAHSVPSEQRKQYFLDPIQSGSTSNPNSTTPQHHRYPNRLRVSPNRFGVQFLS